MPLWPATSLSSVGSPNLTVWNVDGAGLRLEFEKCFIPTPLFSSPTSNNSPIEASGLTSSVSSAANSMAATLALASTVPRPAIARSDRLNVRLSMLSVAGGWSE